VIMAGLWEDIAGSVQPWHRLGAAVASGVLASHFAGGVVARLDLPVIDGWLEYLPFALPLTWFMVAGACNAMNIIDGAHGLAGGVALLMFGGLAAAGFLEGDRFVFVQSLAVMGAIVGFLVWNYPRGKVFLGDAGAYFLGFMYAELSIQVVARNPGISAWYVIALAAYPITETLYSIYRRKLVLRTESMQPDADHLHSLVYRRLIVRAYLDHSAEPVRNANARVAPRMWLHAAICLGGALLLRDNTPALIAFAALYATFYVACYRTLVRDLSKGRSPRNPATRARQAIRR
jgi:UDP-GlcNAc:undecaprenyl-phosphate GlcNAc-1-phosphate transferase